jgi:hypothetical protein
MRINRRQLLSLTGGALALGSGIGRAAPRGLLIDYARGVPSAAAIRSAGYLGAIRYVSDRRAGAEWMRGKPLLADEALALRAAGLQIVSCYQYGKGPTADWRGGFDAGRRHAARGLELHLRAGGPPDRPIYASIDDNPTAAEFTTLIGPYLAGWQSVLGSGNVGVYANSPTLQRTRDAGLATWFWQHDWGTPRGFVHPAAQLHQLASRSHQVDGVGVDLNAILKPDYGQW